MDELMNFVQPVFLVRANLMFIEIRYKHLEYKTSKASPYFYTTVLTVSGLCIPTHLIPETPRGRANSGPALQP